MVEIDKVSTFPSGRISCRALFGFDPFDLHSHINTFWIYSKYIFFLLFCIVDYVRNSSRAKYWTWDSQLRILVSKWSSTAKDHGCYGRPRTLSSARIARFPSSGLTQKVGKDSTKTSIIAYFCESWSSRIALIVVALRFAIHSVDRCVAYFLFLQSRPWKVDDEVKFHPSGWHC